MKTNLAVIFMLGLLAIGCAAPPVVGRCDFSLPPSGQLMFPLAGDGDYDYAGSGGGGFGPQTMLMAYVGQRWVEEDDWEDEDRWNELGITGVHVINDSGLGIDWAVLNVGFDHEDKEIDNGGDLNLIDESIVGIEGQVGLRYIFKASDSVWPFLRAGLVLQHTEYEYSVFIPTSGTEITVEGDSFGPGFGIGTGIDFAFGGLRLEIGAGYSWMKNKIDLEATFNFGVPFTIDFGEEKASLGAEPNIWIAIGGGF